MTSAACLIFVTFYFRILGKHIKTYYRIMQKATTPGIMVIKKNRLNTVIHLHKHTVMKEITSNYVLSRHGLCAIEYMRHAIYLRYDKGLIMCSK